MSTSAPSLAYFTGAVTYNSFISVPRSILTDYPDLSSDSRILYMLMLDRASLSYKNNYVDKEGRAYILLSQASVMKWLHCASEKANKTMKALVSCGLVEVMRKGQGQVNRYYVKTVDATSKNSSNRTTAPDTSTTVTDPDNYPVVPDSVDAPWEDANVSCEEELIESVPEPENHTDPLKDLKTTQIVFRGRYFSEYAVLAELQRLLNEASRKKPGFGTHVYGEFYAAAADYLYAAGIIQEPSSSYFEQLESYESNSNYIETKLSLIQLNNNIDKNPLYQDVSQNNLSITNNLSKPKEDRSDRSDIIHDIHKQLRYKEFINTSTFQHCKNVIDSLIGCIASVMTSTAQHYTLSSTLTVSTKDFKRQLCLLDKRTFCELALRIVRATEEQHIYNPRMYMRRALYEGTMALSEYTLGRACI